MYRSYVFGKPTWAAILGVSLMVALDAGGRTALAQNGGRWALDQKPIDGATAKDIGLVTLERFPPAVTQAFKLVERLKFPVKNRKSLATQIITKQNAKVSPLAVSLVMAAYRPDEYPIKDRSVAVAELHKNVLRNVGLHRIPNPEFDPPFDRPVDTEPIEFDCQFDDSPCGRAAARLAAAQGAAVGPAGLRNCGRLRRQANECGDELEGQFGGYSAECQAAARNAFADEYIDFLAVDPILFDVEEIIRQLFQTFQTAAARRMEAVEAALAAGHNAAVLCELLRPLNPDVLPDDFPPLP